MSDGRSGSYRCGAIRFTAKGVWNFIGNCHCAACRKSNGSIFSTFIGYREDQVEWSGEHRIYESTPGVMRGFCPDCGTPLTYQGQKWPGEIHLLLGAFNDQADLKPTSAVFVEEALPFAPRVETTN